MSFLQKKRSYILSGSTGRRAFNGVSITLNDTLKNLEQIFSKDKFFRCHQSFLVNLNYIEGIRVENGGNVFFLQLHGCQDCIPLSRKAYPELKKCLEAHGIWFH